MRRTWLWPLRVGHAARNGLCAGNVIRARQVYKNVSSHSSHSFAYAATRAEGRTKNDIGLRRRLFNHICIRKIREQWLHGGIDGDYFGGRGGAPREGGDLKGWRGGEQVVEDLAADVARRAGSGEVSGGEDESAGRTCMRMRVMVCLLYDDMQSWMC